MPRLVGFGVLAFAVSVADQDALRRRKLVRRSHFLGIVAAWAITVPSAVASRL